MDIIPLEILFPATVILIIIAIELGYRIGNSHTPQSKKENEKITLSNAASILGMLGFILVFTFGIVYSRYDSKKALVREEANIIRTVWQRSDFLPEPDRIEAEKLIKQYLDLRIEAVQSNELENIQNDLKESVRIQHLLWDMAAVNARKDMNSHVFTLYLESLNDMTNQQALRVAIGLQARIPVFMWILLYVLVFLGMFGIGYQGAISFSGRRSWLTPIMILSFSVIIILIASLDRPQSRFIPVSQQPLVDLRTWMETGTGKQ